MSAFHRRTVGLLMAVGLVIAACGGGTDDAAPAPAPAPAPEAPAAEEVCEGSNLRWRYSTNSPEASNIEGSTRYIMERLEERTNGQVEIEPFWAASLIPQGEDYAAIQSGQIDIGHVVQAVYGNEFPLWGLTAIPFTNPDPEAQLRAMVELYETNELFANEFESQGFYPLYFKPLSGFAFGSPREINTLEDLRGLRLRVIGRDASATFAAVGVEPISVNLTEVRDAVARGTVDSWGAIPMELAVALGLHEVSPYVVNSGVGVYTAIVNLMSLEKWNAIPDCLKEILTELIDESYDFAIGELSEREELACQKMLEAGTTVITLSDAEQDRWRGLVREDLLTGWRTRAVEAGYAEADVRALEEQYFGLVDKYKANSAWVNGMDDCTP